MLTRKQYDLLLFIHDRVQRDGVSPSFDEMKAALDLRSKSGIHRLITALEERGFIRRLPHRARAIEILKLPENMGEPRGRAGFRPSVIDGDLAGRPTTDAIAEIGAERVRPAEHAEVPLIGRIAAGVPIEAIEQGDNKIIVPSAMTAASGDHYALEVKGDSMIEAGINDGDVVVINPWNSRHSSGCEPMGRKVTSSVAKAKAPSRSPRWNIPVAITARPPMS